MRASDTDIPGHIYSDESLDAANGDERVSNIDILAILMCSASISDPACVT